jgi:hypothetical protein
MKKLSRKQRERDVRQGLINRSVKNKRLEREKEGENSSAWEKVNQWVDDSILKGLNVSFNKKFQVTIHLPEKMNFNERYELSSLHIAAIRKLAGNVGMPNKAYKLAKVDFDNLKKISTSAALVLTAELSKWDDAIRNKLRPIIDNWDSNIFQQFYEIGFFDLFNNNQSLSSLEINSKSNSKSELRVVKYIKGRCGDKAKTRILKNEIRTIVGESIGKWTILDSGLSEAITNVSHHAYPKGSSFSEDDKNWYLTGAYSEVTHELKVVFYDQGIGIPKSLPSSELWERVLNWFSKYSIADRKRHEVLLRAAVEIDRTSTDESDRGKGLPDLLEFVKQRGDGYLSILSSKGMFKYAMSNGKVSVKTENFSQPIYGTLIIWSITLE